MYLLGIRLVREAEELGSHTLDDPKRSADYQHKDEDIVWAALLAFFIACVLVYIYRVWSYARSQFLLVFF